MAIDASLYSIADADRLFSPSLVVFPELIERNIRHMIERAGGPDRLRPHVKTHKMSEIVRMTERLGVRKHKCATIAEAEMVARAGGSGSDILISYPIVGPNVERLRRLVDLYPDRVFRTLVDHPEGLAGLSRVFNDPSRRISILLDLEIGMGRTGIAPGEAAVELYEALSKSRGLAADGLHAYDGQIKQSEPAARRIEATPGQTAALELRARLVARGLPAARLVIGGTPSFPIHATLDIDGLECSPGTTTLYDASYNARFPDLPFVPAALLWTRVVSKPRPGRVCLDLGHKAVAADPVGPRATLLGLPDAVAVIHSEEHLVVETAHADRMHIGQGLLAVPTHICPTCALHKRAYVIQSGVCAGEWDVDARDRQISV